MAALEPHEVTVAGQEAFVAVLNDLPSAAVSSVQRVAARAASECLVDDVGKLEPENREGVVLADRFKTSASNVFCLASDDGVTAALAEVLAS